MSGDSKTTQTHQGSSHLFLVRLWVGDKGDDPQGWRGKVQHMVTGEAHNFEGVAELTQALLRMLHRKHVGPREEKP